MNALQSLDAGEALALAEDDLVLVAGALRLRAVADAALTDALERLTRARRNIAMARALMRAGD